MADWCAVQRLARFLCQCQPPRRTGSGDDVVRNIVRSVAEERLNLAVERPAAICWIKNLPDEPALRSSGTTAKRSSK